MWILQNYITLSGVGDDLKFSNLYIHLTERLSFQPIA